MKKIKKTVDIESELTKLLSEQIAKEIDKERKK